ncbi:MAG: bis(5'-nucleosyl)-tetraphosphatase (symmetrical) YqeK [Firmicutes bacterium]|nr:bis(5'-nucleosyl)-tetraphosphatase (symmetrical) YqeK [Bacillota bacterium]
MDYTDEQAIARAKAFMDGHMKPSRRRHTENVVETAVKLAKTYGADPEKAELAAWFHDLVRNLDPEELDADVDRFGLDPGYKGNVNLSHGKIAAERMKRDYGITDEDVLNAVSYHTTGRAGMSTLEKVVFLADVIEPGRSHPSVEENRRIGERDLDQGCLFALEHTIDYVNSRGEYLDPDTLEAAEDLARRAGNTEEHKE